MNRRIDTSNEERVVYKISKAMSNDPELTRLFKKNGENSQKIMDAAEKLYDAKRQGLSKKEIDRWEKFYKDAQAEYDKTYNDTAVAFDKLMNRYTDELGSARLKDIRVEDTAAGREYVMSQYKSKTSIEKLEDYEESYELGLIE